MEKASFDIQMTPFGTFSLKLRNDLQICQPIHQWKISNWKPSIPSQVGGGGLIIEQLGGLEASCLILFCEIRYFMCAGGDMILMSFISNSCITFWSLSVALYPGNDSYDKSKIMPSFSSLTIFVWVTEICLTDMQHHSEETLDIIQKYFSQNQFISI